MSIVEMMDKRERELLSRYAAKSADARRAHLMSPCPIRTNFQRDRDRILHSKAFRRLKHKTQVFIAPEGDHFRTRLTHTLEVAQIARTIARALLLNEDLAEAIALGHDLGHTPFGHAGEDVLNELLPEGFRHDEHSGRVVERLEGLNLTDVVTDGIINHRSSGDPVTLEGRLVQISDKIAYINHDIDDGIRAGILSPADLPQESTYILGSTSSERINRLIIDIIEQSSGEAQISASPDMLAALAQMRSFMFGSVYRCPALNLERSRIGEVITALFNHYTNNPETLPEDYRRQIEDNEPLARVVGDYIAGMTDRFADRIYSTIAKGDKNGVI